MCPLREVARSSARASPPRVDRSAGALQVPSAVREATCAADQSPLERIQPTAARPSASATTFGAEALCPVEDRMAGSDHCPSAVRVAACTSRYTPSDHTQAATAPPWSSRAIAGARGFPTGSATSSAGAHAPSILRNEERTTARRFWIATQTTPIVPAWASTFGPKPGSPGAERSSGGVHLPPAGLTAARTTLPVFVGCCQATTAFPWRSRASAGDSAPLLSASLWELQSPPRGRTAARSATESPSASRQTATRPPLPSVAMSGRDASMPAGEMSLG